MCSECRIILELIFCVALLISYTSTVRLPRRTNSNGCTLPQHPAFGQWTIYEGTTPQSPGKLVPSGTILELSCHENYKVDGEDISTCVRGQWKPKLNSCLRTCPTITDTPFMMVSCTFNGRTVENCANAIEGTIARFACAAFYEDQRLGTYSYRLCSNGSWGKVPECVPVCGKKSSDPRLLVGATETKRGEYPWQIALYTVSDKFLICGGSLLNERVVLTAAHCVTDLSGELQPKDRYIMAAGKYFRKYDHLEDFNKTQISPISEMYIPRQYKGELQNYFGDIAILISVKTFVLSHRVQPVCVDWGFGYFQNVLNSTTSQHGFVTGWGFTVEYKDPSNVLKVLEVPIIKERECNLNVPIDNKNLLTDDKLCAGFLNSSASVCKGDSGGGLVYKFEGRYYLLGVVSVSPPAQTQEGGCDSQQYTLYTNVSYYTENFILDKEARFRPSVFGDLKCNYDRNCGIPIPTVKVVTKKSAEVNGNCVIPPHPKLGKWSVFGQQPYNVSPGDSIGSGTTLLVQCDEHYKPEGTNVTVCLDGIWTQNTGRCSIKVCPSILSTPYMKVTCIYENTETENCIDALNGTVAKFECLREDLRPKTSQARVCQNGTWDHPAPSCTPVPVTTKITSNSQRYLRNSNISISCIVNGFPTPQVRWYKDDILLTTSNRVLITERSRLTILQSTTTDSGLYQCEARNVYSKSVSSITILVNEMHIHPNCTDNAFFANCDLIVRGGYCLRKYYNKFCCRTCTEAGILPVYGSHLSMDKNQMVLTNNNF